MKADDVDTAHMIRSRNTANTRAVCSLEAEHRWAVTGTPIQNRLGDLCSLLRFLRVHPYDDPKIFENEISQPWKTRVDETALHKLQSLVKMISLRRPQSVVTLPRRQELLHYIEFTPEEFDIYEKARLGTIDFIENALSSDHATGSAFINAFQRINDLRYICNHGIAPMRKLKARHEENVSKRGLTFQEQLDKFLGAATLACLKCGTDVDEAADLALQYLNMTTRPSEAAQQLCKTCLNKMRDSNCPSPTSSPSSSNDDPQGVTAPSFRRSSKVNALVQHLQQVPPSDKCAVFSYWTSTLNLIEQALTQANITYCRYDGRLSRTKRDAVLSTFANEPKRPNHPRLHHLRWPRSRPYIREPRIPR
jgi:SWI/SNF-related matrix-associated actin-dependent regulator of chromatin subfamily A3